jgi:hypothetical protein
MTQEAILEKLAKIKRMADSAAAIGSEAEAEAFAAMLQKMLINHKLEMSDLEFEKMEKEQPVEKHYINYDQYPDIKLRRTRVLWIEQMASIVARAHFCRILIHPGSSRITLVGRKEDFVVAEYMIITLQRIIEHISDKAAYHYRLECHRLYGNGNAAKGFRESFTLAFIRRLAERYELEKNAMTETSTALVRVNKAEEAVVAFMKAKFSKGKASALSHTLSSFNSEGYKRGTDAANAINLRTNALNTSGGPKKLR